MPDPNKSTDGGPPREIHIEKKKTNWFAWIALLLGILALLLALSRCHREPDQAASPPTDVVAATPNAARSAALVGTSGLGAYLAGTDAAPRTFTFDTLKFDTAKSDIRPADRAEVATVAGVLAKYPAAHVRIAGYADARGSDAANVALGKSRADAVKSALVATGIDGSRIDTASGGETDPVDNNATASGQAENRRTELVVTQR